MQISIQQTAQLLELVLLLEFIMYKMLYKLPEPLVDAILYYGLQQPQWTDEYYQLVKRAYDDWQSRLSLSRKV